MYCMSAWPDTQKKDLDMFIASSPARQTLASIGCSTEMVLRLHEILFIAHHFWEREKISLATLGRRAGLDRWRRAVLNVPWEGSYSSFITAL